MTDLELFDFATKEMLDGSYIGGYQKLIRLSENGYDPASRLLAEIEIIAYNYSLALEFYLRIKIKEPEDLSKIGECYLGLKDYENSIIYFDKAIQEGNYKSCKFMQIVMLKTGNINKQKYYCKLYKEMEKEYLTTCSLEALFKEAKAMNISPNNYSKCEYYFDNENNRYVIDFLKDEFAPIAVLGVKGHGYKYAGNGILALDRTTRVLVVDVIEIASNMLEDSIVGGLILSARVSAIENNVLFQNLEFIYVNELNNNYSSVDNVLFNIDKTLLIAYPANKKDEIYEIPDSVKRISPYAFSYTPYLKKVIINRDVIVKNNNFNDVEIIYKD